MTVAITDYASLTTAINEWAVRTYTSGQTDQFIALAEGEFRLYLGPNFAKETSATLTVTSGAATLPTGYVRPVAMTHATYGTLTQMSVDAVRQRRVWDTGGIPDIYAITGTSVLFAPSFTGSATFDYEGTLTGLSSGNTTNWLITNAPQAYLSMCLSMEKAFQEDYPAAAALKSSSLRTLDELGLQSIVGQQGRAGISLPGMTP